MASKSELKIVDTEQLEWLSKSFHGLIIGKKGSGLKELKEKVGVDTAFLDDHCFISGYEEQVNQAKLFIAQKVKKQELWHAKKQGISLPSCVPTGLIKNEPWEVIDIHPRYYKYIADENLQTRYGVTLRLRKNEEGSSIVVCGSPAATMKIKEWFEDFKSKQKELYAQRKKELEEMMNGEDCESIDIEEKYIPRIIGKGGSVKTNLEKKHDVIIHIEQKCHQVYIKGDINARRNTIIDIELLMFDNVKREISGGGLKGSTTGIFYVGLSDNNDVSLGFTNCVHGQHTKIVSYPLNSTFDKAWNNISGLKEIMTGHLEKLRALCDDDNTILGDIMIHCGIIHYKYKPGSYKIATLRCNKKLLEYERFMPKAINFDKLEKLPVLVNYIRFDLKIFAANPSIELRYKIFIKDCEGSIQFLNIEETDVSAAEVLKILVGPGYFCHPEHRISRMDVIDPSTNFTTRINISMIRNKKDFNDAVETHVEGLRDFFENITVEKVNEKVELVLPEIGGNYKVTFVRYSERKCYELSEECILKTSKEKISKCEDGNIEGSSTDIFYKNEKLCKLFEDGYWCVDEVENILETMFRLSDSMSLFT